MLRRLHPAIRIVATEVIAGEWGDGQERIQALRDRGFNPKVVRSEERRVGKECRSRWSPYH